MDHHLKEDANSDVVNYQRVVFGEVETRYLAVPTQYKMCLVHTTELNFEETLIFDASAIKGHKTF